MGASRVEERFMCAMGLSTSATIEFESCESIPNGGVMLLLPFLLECGLMSYRDHYTQRKGYYNFDSLFIILALIYLCRIKSIEQTKNYSPGEFGKLVGYDRIPEVKTLRSMIAEITEQKQGDQWAVALSKNWINREKPELYYIDGHVTVYNGYLANLGRKHVSRQRLCLPGVMSFWVNASDGSPYFYVTADVNEKMGEILNDNIVPDLLKLHPVSDEQKKKMSDNPDEPVFTLVFDREAYSPKFFTELWDKHRIAVITYRKNVKDKWDESQFTDYPVVTYMGNDDMKLSEQNFCAKDGKYTMREVRKLNDDGHQTSIVTTNKVLSIAVIASYMFARWVQENFFRYMRLDYAFDKMIQYSTDELDGGIMVVNIEYSRLTSKIAKAKEKLHNREAKLYEFDEKNPPLKEENGKENKKLMKTRLTLVDHISKAKEEEANLVEQP
jgi:hypothetical protein